VRHVPPRALATFAFVNGPPKDAAAAGLQECHRPTESRQERMPQDRHRDGTIGVVSEVLVSLGNCGEEAERTP
jgi:hypothetical protein